MQSVYTDLLTNDFGQCVLAVQLGHPQSQYSWVKSIQTAASTNSGKRTFAFSAPGLYNSLPQSVRETGGGFKAALKEHLLNLALN